jgi:hypothetical protein
MEALFTLAALGVAGVGIAFFLRAQRQRRRAIAVAENSD